MLYINTEVLLQSRLIMAKINIADQICYSVLCVFSYVAAGSDKSNMQKPKPPKSTPSQLPISCLRPTLSPQDPPASVKAMPVPHPQTQSISVPSPEPGAVTPVGGPPNYPPPALPPGVAPPAQPPGGRTFVVPAQLPAGARPPPVPQRSMSLSSSQPPPTPPRPK